MTRFLPLIAVGTLLLGGCDSANSFYEQLSNDDLDEVADDLGLPAGCDLENLPSSGRVSGELDGDDCSLNAALRFGAEAGRAGLGSNVDLYAFRASSDAEAEATLESDDFLPFVGLGEAREDGDGDFGYDEDEDGDASIRLAVADGDVYVVIVAGTNEDGTGTGAGDYQLEVEFEGDED